MSHSYDCGRPCYYCLFVYLDRKSILTTNTHTLQIEEILELLP
ncbi:3-hydroxyacyl-[acyl-carrier-protein] dehydratase FabZ, partial [Salmonella enterica subsp. enterica serovar Rubislaw]